MHHHEFSEYGLIKIIYTMRYSTLHCLCSGHDSSVTRPLLSPVSGSVCNISNGGYSTLSGAKSDLCVPIPIPMYLRTRTGHVVSGSVRMRKCRRSRTVFSELQLMGLEKRFDTQKYLSTPDRADLGKQLGLSQLQVKTWYQNRRMKWKRQVQLQLKHIYQISSIFVI